MRIISYKDDIITWIEDCIKEVAQVPIIRKHLYNMRAFEKRLQVKEKE